MIGVLANGYDVHYGARSIKYEVERRVVNKLASAHENQLMLPGAKVHVVVSEDGEEFTFAKVEQPKHSLSIVVDDQHAEQGNAGDEETDETTSPNKKQIEWKLKLLIDNVENPTGGTNNSPGKGGGFLSKIGFA